MIRLFGPRDYIDVETRGPDEMRRRALEFGGDNRSASEWRLLARRVADLVDAPISPRDLVRRACRELGIGPNAAPATVKPTRRRTPTAPCSSPSSTARWPTS